ncbi:phosphotransferase family protein [Cryptosporangium phraense]|uniref:phosphotransferase family protein n=1 Tax=Cryptosporangium phraense TaxID=2593070 RepID=UPI00197AD597|nr:phosphotransferase family protein [Cryptosporangium phraense]
MPTNSDDTEQLRAALQDLFARHWGPGTVVGELTALTGGASRSTHRFPVTADGREHTLILRRDTLVPAPDSTLLREAAALSAAHDAGVPTPEVLVAGVGPERHPYLIMRHVPGEAIPRRLLRDPEYAGIRPRLARELGALAARIHAVPDPPSLLTRPHPLELLRDISDTYDDPRPTAELGFTWLHTHRPPDAPDTLVHGDLRTGNVLIGPDGIRAALDWELAHVGDPVEDLGWLCVKAWRFGSPHPAGGFGSRRDLLDGYRTVAGWTPTPDQLHWWEVYGTLRWVLLCRQQATVHLRGLRDSLEHAVIGRRVCEAEFDLLLALGLTHPDPAVGPEAAPGPADVPRLPHDAPDATHLITAVADAFRAGAFGSTYLGRVAANALSIAARELTLGPELASAHSARLAALGLASDADLAARIRTGDTTPAITDAVVATVRDKLRVANPAYLAQPVS